MADDNNQRPYRPGDTRATPTTNTGTGNDPLAELARLIGQSDPFAEFGRDNTRRAGVPEQPSNWSPPTAAPAYNPPPASAPRTPGVPYAAGSMQQEPGQGFGAPNYQQPGYDGFAFNSGAGLYRTGNEAPSAYPGAPGPGEEYSGGGFYQEPQPHAETDFYDETLPPRRRIGVVAIAAVFALAVVGTAGAFGYRAIFGSSGTRTPPPVIKADNAPMKVVPSAASKDPQSSKMITDRVGDRQGEKMVSREEKPMDNAGLPSVPGPIPQSSPLAPANGSGVVTTEPKKIHTITIRPDQVGMADTGASAPMPAAAQAPVQTSVAAPPPRAEIPPPPAAARPAPVQRTANVPPVVAETNPEQAPEPRPAAARAPAPAPAHSTAVASNAPLSLNPNAAPPRPSAPVHAAAPAAPAAPARAAPAPSSGGGYAVQVSAQRSEAEAQAAFRSMQAKFPTQLGSREPLIRRVDLGEKGIYFRAMIGPFASGNEATQVCSSLKSAGGQCIVQKI
jgi:hypothetical protein